MPRGDAAATSSRQSPRRVPRTYPACCGEAPTAIRGKAKWRRARAEIQPSVSEHRAWGACVDPAAAGATPPRTLSRPPKTMVFAPELALTPELQALPARAVSRRMPLNVRRLASVVGKEYLAGAVVRPEEVQRGDLLETNRPAGLPRTYPACCGEAPTAFSRALHYGATGGRRASIKLTT